MQAEQGCIVSDQVPSQSSSVLREKPNVRVPNWIILFVKLQILSGNFSPRRPARRYSSRRSWTSCRTCATSTAPPRSFRAGGRSGSRRRWSSRGWSTRPTRSCRRGPSNLYPSKIFHWFCTETPLACSTQEFVHEEEVDENTQERTLRVRLINKKLHISTLLSVEDFKNRLESIRLLYEAGKAG